MQQQPSYRYINIVPFKSLVNWSASFALGNTLDYKEGFKLVKIGKLIERNKTKIEIQDNVSYRRVTIRLYGKGVMQRDEVMGNTIGTKNQFVISPGQFIMSKIDARNGAFGIVSSELEGAIVTQDFLSYNINTNLVNPDFFLFLTSTQKFLDLCQRASSGTTGRQRIDETAFLNFQIPVPSIVQQEKLVAQYQEKTNNAKLQIEKAKNISANIDSYLIDVLGLSINSSNYEKKQIHIVRFKNVEFWGIDKILGANIYQSKKYSTITLEKNPGLVLNAIRGKSPIYDVKGKYLILNQKCNRWNKIELEFAKRVNDNWFKSLDRDLFTKVGDILINSTGEGTIGRASLVTKEFEGFMFDSHMLLLRVDATQINPDYLVFLINHNYGQSQINNLKSAKSTKQTELGIRNLMKIFFPLPDKTIQNTIVQEINQKRNNAEKQIQMAMTNTKESLAEFETSIFK